MIQAALRWLGARRSERPFFLYVHTMGGHVPYQRIPESEVEGRRSALLADQRPLDSLIRDRIGSIARLPDGRPIVRTGFEPSLALLELAYD